MKKRIKAVQIFQNTHPITLHIDYLSPNKQHNDQLSNVKHYPKFQTQRSKNEQINKLKIKQFNHPVMSELRQLVINCIASGNYFAKCIKGQIPEGALKLYYQDSTKLTQYLNCLVVTKINHHFETYNLDLDKQIGFQCQKLDSFIKKQEKSDKSKNKYFTGYNQHELRRESIDGKKRVSQLQKTQPKVYDVKQLRSQQSVPLLQKQFSLGTSQKFNVRQKTKLQTNRFFTQRVNDEMSRLYLGGSVEMKDMKLRQKHELSRIKLRLQYLTKENKNLNNKNNRLSLQVQKFKNNSVYMDLHLFRSEQMILQFASYFQNNSSYLFDKQKTNILLASLDNYLCITKKQNLQFSGKNSILRMKHQIEELTIEVSNYRRYAMQLIQQKQMLIEQALNKKRHQQLQQDLQYEEMKSQINKLNEDLGDLMREVSRKDELIELIKADNDSLRYDLIGLEEMNKTLNENEKLLGEEMTGLQDQIQIYQIQIEKQNDHIQQLNSEMYKKDKRIFAQLGEIQSRQQQIISLRKQYKAYLLDSNEVISQLQQYIKIAELEKHKVEGSYQNISKDNLILKEKNRLLQDKIQRMLYQKKEYERTIQALKKRIQPLNQQNILFHQDIKMHNEQKQQQKNINLIKQQSNYHKRSNLSNDYSFRQFVFKPKQFVLGDQNSNSLINISILQIIDQKAEGGDQKADEVEDNEGEILFKCHSENEKLDIIKDLQNSINNREDSQFKNTAQYNKKNIEQDYQQGYYSDDGRLVQIYKETIRNYSINILQNHTHNQGRDHQPQDHSELLSMNSLDLQDEKYANKLKEIVQFQHENGDHNQQIIGKCRKECLSFRQPKKEINLAQNNRGSQRKRQKKREDEQEYFRNYFISNKKQDLIAQIK